MRAITTLDEGRIADAYLAGDIDLDGDMEKPFALRGDMKDFHLWTEAWRYIQPFLFGQVHTNKNSSASATAPSANQSEAGAGGEVAIIVAKSISLTVGSDTSNASSLSVGTETSSTSLVQNVQTSKGSYQIYLQNNGIDTPFGRALGL